MINISQWYSLNNAKNKLEDLGDYLEYMKSVFVEAELGGQPVDVNKQLLYDFEFNMSSKRLKRGSPNWTLVKDEIVPRSGFEYFLVLLQDMTCVQLHHH